VATAGHPRGHPAAAKRGGRRKSDEADGKLNPPDDLPPDSSAATADTDAAKGKGCAPKPFTRPLTVQEHQFAYFYVRGGEGSKVAPQAYRQAFAGACDGQSAIKVSMRAYALLQQPAVQAEIQHQRDLMVEERGIFDQKMREAAFDKVTAIRNLEYDSFEALWRSVKFHSNWVANGKPPLPAGTKAIELGMKVTGNLKTEGAVAQITVTPDDVAKLDAEIEKLVGEKRNGLAMPADAPLGNPEGRS
jgi:hypothetical protein